MDEARTDQIRIRLSPKEKALIRSAAKSVKRNLSDYVRIQALYGDSWQDPGSALEDVREQIENDPSNLNVTLDDQGALVAKEVGKPMAYESPPEEVEVPISRDMWIASTARILMMEKGLSKIAATMQATKEWEAAND
jgi:Protein of unknown function (DUF1778)